MALGRDPPWLGDIWGETGTWEARERRREEQLERAFEASRVPATLG